MPHNNPDREGLDSGPTVYIDGPLELQSHLMPQELETLGLTDLEALDDSQVMDTSGVLMPDQPLLDVHREPMDTSDGSLSQSMDVDSASEANNTIEMDLLQSDFEPVPQEKMPGITQGSLSANANHKYVLAERKTIGLSTVSNENNPPHVLKTSQGHYLILQQNQSTPQPAAQSNKNLIQNVISIGNIANSNITKTVYTTSLGSNAIAKPQFRTIQVRPSSTFTQGQSTNNVAKYIVNNQGVTSQIKTISTNSTTGNVNEKSAPSKYTFQLVPNTANGKPTPVYTTSDAQVVKIPPAQPIPFNSSNKLSYIRVLPPSESKGNAPGVPSVPKIVNIKKPITASTQNLNIKTIHMPQQTMNSGISTSTVQVRPQNSLTLPAQVLSNAQTGSLVVIPTHYLQNNGTSNSVGGNVVQSQSIQDSPPAPPVTTTKPPVSKTVFDANGLKPRKPCNCTKSQCLKLYCDCFTNGEFCFNCNCTNCFNNLGHEEERQKAIRACLERNPNAFRPKIGKGSTQNERRHNKGCNCKRSGCLKNYCECYEAKIPCSDICKCVGCRNIDTLQPTEKQKVMQMSEPPENSVVQKSFVKNRPYSMPILPSPVKVMFPSSGKSIHCCINTEIVEASCHCLLAQAEKVQKRNGTQEEAELAIINEFSMCVQQIISLSGKNKGA